MKWFKMIRHLRRGHSIRCDLMTPLLMDTGSSKWYRCTCGENWL